MILPDATLGVLGGGQLGRMFTLAAYNMGYRVVVLDPDPLSPAGKIAHQHLQSDYRDHAALQMLGDECAAVTTEFENVPADSLEFLSKYCQVRPSADAVRIGQDRIREKTYVREQGLTTTPFSAVYEVADLEDGFADLQPPLLLKTASMGYDGKGQVQVDNLQEAQEAFRQLGEVPCILEEMVDLACEVSVILARSTSGSMAIYPVGENRHANGILDITIVPANIEPGPRDSAISMARTLAESMNYVGVLAVEFFCTRDNRIMINEIATRPHNSGHYTVDACATSQFEQQVRMMCGLEPGDTTLLSPVVMSNLLGDIWKNGSPAWDVILKQPQTHLHLYGKHEPREGRKMGHFNCLAENVDDALEIAESIRTALEP